MKSLTLVVALALSLFLIAAGCTQPASTAPEVPIPPAPVPTYTPNETLVAFVDSAVAYVKTHGKEQALAEFSNPKGSFMQGELYIYAYDFNGTTLAHPINPESVGKKREGANGVFVTEFGKAIRKGNGSAFYPFVYVNPAHNKALETKLGYAVAVDDTWWLGSGKYTGPVEPAVAALPGAPSTSQEIRDFVDNAAAYAQKNGKGAALTAFSNRSGPFVAGNVYIYALDYSGHILALPFQPQLTGTDFSPLPDSAGRYYTRTEITLAQQGGGYLLYQYPNPAENFSVRYKVSYVRPVDDQYWIGAGAYTREDLLLDPELRAFVAEAKTYAVKNGKEKALAEFNNKNGSFVRGELYVFAYDYNGTSIAWPYRPDLVGTDRSGATDPVTGTRHIQAMLSAARNGTTLVEYYSVNPSTNTTQLKIVDVADIDGTWMIGAGRYMEPGPRVLRG
ncbi:MAG: histidine kinase [Methanomicrobiales archaeon]|nr:histidine kinase [Methanomicrobiales archaeon]